MKLGLSCSQGQGGSSRALKSQKPKILTLLELLKVMYPRNTQIPTAWQPPQVSLPTVPAKGAGTAMSLDACQTLYHTFVAPLEGGHERGVGEGCLGGRRASDVFGKVY